MIKDSEPCCNQKDINFKNSHFSPYQPIYSEDMDQLLSSPESEQQFNLSVSISKSYVYIVCIIFRTKLQFVFRNEKILYLSQHYSFHLVSHVLCFSRPLYADGLIIEA